MIWGRNAVQAFEAIFFGWHEMTVEFTKTDVIKKVFSSIRAGEEFDGLQFKQWCIVEDPKLEYTYEDTFLRILRKHFREQFVCIDRKKSKYKKVERRRYE